MKKSYALLLGEFTQAAGCSELDFSRCELIKESNLTTQSARAELVWGIVWKDTIKSSITDPDPSAFAHSYNQSSLIAATKSIRTCLI